MLLSCSRVSSSSMLICQICPGQDVGSMVAGTGKFVHMSASPAPHCTSFDTSINTTKVSITHHR
jgi:hypothetical protein